jgi:hypothetical protein
MRAALICLSIAFAATTVALEFRRWNNSRQNTTNKPILTYTTPIVPKDFDRKFTYPSKQTPGEMHVDDGPATYLRHHKAAWNECIRWFVRDWPHGELNDELTIDSDPFPAWQIAAPDHVNAARFDGWRTAVRQLKERLKSQDENVLRREIGKPPTVHAASILTALAAIIAAALALWTESPAT